MDQYIGKLLDNRYEILERVGAGGMAMVYKARCHRLNRLVAIKILREDLAQDAEFRRRFHDESQAVAMLSHPNIVAVYDVSRSSEFEYIVMELIDGVTLKQYMQQKGNKLNWREALHFITQITKALSHAHSRGIIHRDIKPHNVMVLRDGSVKVADFGIARLTNSGHSTLTQETLGSVHYISPEQAKGSHIDARSDLYSAGVVLYEMITGRLPFEGDSPVSVAIQHINSIPLSPQEIDPSIPEALEEITMKAMSPSLDQRYLSADAMLADLEEFRKNPNINFDYKLNDSSAEEPDGVGATQVHRISDSVRSMEVRGNQRRRQREEEEPPRQEFPWTVAAAVVVLLLFLGGMFYFLVSFLTGLSQGAQNGDTYTIPTVTGQLITEARNNSELLGEFVIVEGGTEDDDSEPGTILSQSPTSGTKVTDPTTEIVVVVSSGPATVEMINVKNWEYNAAYVALRNLGLTVEEPEYQYSDEVAADHVISSTPSMGEAIEAGSSVALVVSKGPETFPLISFVGMDIEAAKTKLSGLNLILGNVDEIYSDTVPAGEVTDQWPAASATVRGGDSVDLRVSQGPVPGVSTQTPGGLEGTTVSIPLPVFDGMIHLRVTMDGETIFNNNVDAAMNNPYDIQVPGSGDKVLLIYIDGKYYTEMPVTLLP